MVPNCKEAELSIRDFRSCYVGGDTVGKILSSLCHG